MNRLGKFLMLNIALAAAPVLPICSDPAISLEEAVYAALQSSPELEQLTAELSFLKEKAAALWTASLPEITIAYSGSKTVQNHLPDSSSGELAVSFSAPIYDRGTAEERISEMKRRIREAELKRKYLHEDIIFRVMGSYLNALKTAEINRIQEQAVINLGKQAAIAENKRELGFITETAFREILISFEMMKNEYSRTRDTAEIAAGQFNILLGSEKKSYRPSGRFNTSFSGITAIGTESGPGPGTGLPGSIDHYITAAAGKNPDLRRLRDELTAAVEDTAKAAMDFIPAVNCSFQLLLSGPDFSTAPPVSSLAISFSFDRILKDSEAAAEFAGSPGIFRAAAFSVRTGLPELNPYSMQRLKPGFIAGAGRALEQQLYLKINDLISGIRYRKRSFELLIEQISLYEIKQAVMEKKAALGEVMLTDLTESQIELSGLRISLMDTASAVLNDELELIRISGIDPPLKLLESLTSEKEVP